MSVYKSSYSGLQIDNVIGLFHNKGLGSLNGIVKRESGSGNFVAAVIPFDDLVDKPTTLEGYGIIDAKIINGIITLGSNTITPVKVSDIGAVNGVAPLNASQKIDAVYLPSYVDDVIEGYYYNNKFYKESTYITEIIGEAGKIYVDLNTNRTYRYSGSSFIEVSQGSVVTISRNLTSGTKSATITIDGTTYDIYSTNNTTYSAGTGLSLDSTTFNVKLGYTTSGNNRAVQADSSGNLYVVQKDDDTDTHRPIKVNGTEILGNNITALDLTAGSNITLSNLGGVVTINATVEPYSLPVAVYNTLGGVKPWRNHTVSATGPTAGSVSTEVAVNSVSTTAGRYYAIETDNNGRLFVNVPWIEGSGGDYSFEMRIDDIDSRQLNIYFIADES